VRALIGQPAGTPSLRLLADQTAAVLAGVAQALNGLALLVDDPARPFLVRRRMRLSVPDWLPPLLNAGARSSRSAPSNSSGSSPRGRAAPWPSASPRSLSSSSQREPIRLTATAMSFMVGIGLAVVLAAIIEFAVLPGLETFAASASRLALSWCPLGR